MNKIPITHSDKAFNRNRNSPNLPTILLFCTIHIPVFTDTEATCQRAGGGKGSLGAVDGWKGQRNVAEENLFLLKDNYCSVEKSSVKEF